jgi:tRNA(adenine34) deaminase
LFCFDHGAVNSRVKIGTMPPADDVSQIQQEAFMRLALNEARAAQEEGEVPVGAIVVRGEEVLGRGHNRSITDSDPSGHAEIVALRDAARKVANHRLIGCTLYVTVEPCAMCAGAIVQARLARLVYGCADPKAGAVRTLYRIADDERLNHRAEVVSGILEADCSAILREFFRAKRSAGDGGPQ